MTKSIRTPIPKFSKQFTHDNPASNDGSLAIELTNSGVKPQESGALTMPNQLSISTQNIQSFQFNSQEVRTELINFETWWCLADVCQVLSIKDPSRLANRLNPKGTTKSSTLTDGGKQELLFINESNLYKTIFRSNKPEAREFEDWVTSEVLPTIRKTGGYGASQVSLLPVNIPLLPADVPLADLDLTEIYEMLKKECWVKIEFIDGRFMLNSKIIANRLNGIHKPMLRHIFSLTALNKKLKSHFKPIGPDDYDMDWAPYPEYYYMDKEGFWMAAEVFTLNKHSRFFIKEALNHFNELEAALLRLKCDAWERLKAAEIERQKSLPLPAPEPKINEVRLMPAEPWDDAREDCEKAFKAYLEAGGLLYNGDDHMQGVHNSIGLLLTLSYRLHTELWEHRKLKLEAKQLIGSN